MRRLNGMDAMLLYSETPNLHTHTMKVAIIHTAGFAGDFDFGIFRDTVARRLHLLDPLRYKLVDIPYRLHHPMWSENCEVDLDYHLRRVRVPGPGGRRELDQVIGEIASTPLDRSRPLWEFHLPVHVDEPLERVRLTALATLRAKEIHDLLGPSLQGRMMEYLPPSLAPAAFRWQSKHTAHSRIMNVAVSNVPGPRERGHIGGAPVSEIYSVGILSAGSAFNMNAFAEIRRSAGFPGRLRVVDTAMDGAPASG